VASEDSVVASGSPPEPLEGTWIVFMPPLTERELDRLWAELCRYEPDVVTPTGPIRSVLRRVQKYRPNDVEKDEFLRTILSETCIRFKKYYNSSFKVPMDRWHKGMECDTGFREAPGPWVSKQTRKPAQGIRKF
jgi:hypothetical protein